MGSFGLFTLTLCKQEESLLVEVMAIYGTLRMCICITLSVMQILIPMGAVKTSLTSKSYTPLKTTIWFLEL